VRRRLAKTILVATLGLAPAAGAAPGDRASFDSRTVTARVTPPAVPSGVARARADRARSLGRTGVAQTDARTGGLRMLARLDGFLSGPDRRDAGVIALDYVASQQPVTGLDAADLVALRLVRRFTGPDGATHLTWAQEWRGIPAFDSALSVAVASDGRVINVHGAPVHDLQAATAVPALDSGEALAAAARHAGASLLAPRGDRRTGPRRSTRFSGGHTAQLVLFTGPQPSVLAWHVLLHASSSEIWTYVVDAATGAVLQRASQVSHASGLVFDDHPGAGAGGVPKPVDLLPWLDTPTQLRGNNTHVYADLNSDNADQAGELIAPDPVTGDWSYSAARVESETGNCPAAGCTWNHTAPDSWRGTDNATVRQNATQVFAFVNRFHDHLEAAPIAFGEAAGNFQTVNGSPDGLASDALIAETDDGAAGPGGLPDAAHVDNANMFTPPDGTPPRMQMYLFSGPGNADVNAGDDASVVYHEYTHGMAARLVTGPDGWKALSSVQAEGLNEGWADWYAMDYLVGEGLRTDAPASIGDVVVGRYVNRFLRRQPVDCPVGATGAECPGTPDAGPGGFSYGDFARVGPRGAEEHDDGEIWTETLWDLRTRLIADLGPVDGVTRARSLVTRAMELAPPEPSFLDARNAILQADTVAGGTDRDRIWAVFAARGMGWFASALDATEIEVVESFALPPTGPAVEVRGAITDAATGDPIQGATVTFAGHRSGFPADLHATTDAAGQYSMAAVPEGTYPQLLVARPGYGRVVQTKVAIFGDPRTINVKLRRNHAAASGGATVTGDQPYSNCPLAAAVDESRQSGWAADAGAERRLVVKLPAAVRLTSFVIDPRPCGVLGRSASLGAYRIETAPEDGGGPGAFTTAVDGAFVKADIGRSNVVRPDTPREAVRYVRLVMKTPQGTASAEGPDDDAWKLYMSVAELEVYAGNNQPPVPAFSIQPETAQTGDTVTFNGFASQDPDGSITKVEWDLDGNGTFESQPGSNRTITKVYDEPSELTVRLRVTDDGGETAQTTRPLAIDSSAEISDLGDLGGPTARPGDINDSDLVVGDADTSASGPGVHAFAFDGGLMTDLGSVSGRRDSLALAVNESGDAVGGVYEDFPASGGRAALFSGGTVTDLGTLGGLFSQATAINDAGTIVGSAQKTDGSGPRRAFVKPVDGPMTDLGTLAGPDDPSGRASRASDVNAGGQVVGWSYTTNQSSERAFLKNPGGPMIDLGTLGGRFSVARAINDQGTVIGYGETAALNTPVHSFIRLGDGSLRDLGTLGGAAPIVTDINNQGDVVGALFLLGQPFHAFLYRNGRLIDLNSLLPAAARDEWELVDAMAINEAGRIVGNGRHKGVERAFLLDLGTCALCVEKVVLEQPRYPDGQLDAVYDNGVVDGNAVKIRATVKNSGTSSQLVSVKFTDTRTKQELPDSRIPGLVLAPGQTKEVLADWDTTGLAWNEDGTPRLSSFVRVSLEVGRRVLDGRTAALRVNPRPVFLVHGLLSSPQTWNAYTTGETAFVKSAHPGWRAFAVPGMNTGSYGTVLGEPNTIYENAEVLHHYIEEKRRTLNAWHVDLVGHSMGGLISRQYIASFMPDSADERPVASHLVMLGTPNQGSACAELLPIAATYELRREVAADFNARVVDRRGVGFSLLAGNSDSFTCTDPTAGDSVVSLPSALWTLTDTTTVAGLAHTSMTGSASAFADFVAPHLAAPPPTGGSGRVPVADARGSVPEGATPQLLVSEKVTVAAGATRDVALPVDQGTRLGLDLVAARTVGSQLIDPDGALVSSVAAASPQAGSLFRTAEVASPKPGAWVLRLTNASASATEVVVSAYVKGSPLDLAVQAGTQADDNTVPIRATLRQSGTGVAGATVAATFSRMRSETTSTVTLHDDGAHGDDAAGDGTYAGRSGPIAPASALTDGLAPGGHLVVVRAQSGTFVRTTITSTHATAIAPPKPTGTFTKQAGDLDPTFGAGGKVVTPVGDNAGASAVVVQPDGRILVAGTSEGARSTYFVTLVRYLEDGTLDATFGDRGRVVVTPYKPFNLDINRPVDLALQPDGKIVVAAGSLRPSYADGYGGKVVRYTANGALDTSFGGGDGLAYVPDAYNALYGLAVLPDGGIVTTGYGFADADTIVLLVSRFDAAGVLDPAYGTDGTVVAGPPPEIAPGGQREAIPTAITADTAGRVAVAGVVRRRIDPGALNPYESRIGVLRLTTAGVPDPGFGGDGWAVLDPVPHDPDAFIGYSSEPVRDIVALPAGQLAVAGSARTTADGYDRSLLVARLQADGTADPAFAGDGVALTDWGSPMAYPDAFGLARQADGRLVVAGGVDNVDTEGDFAVARYGTDGTLDSQFGGDGLVAPVFTKSSDGASAVAIGGDGRLVVAGGASLGFNRGAIALVRILAEETTFRFSGVPPVCVGVSASTRRDTPVSAGLSCSDEGGDAFTYAIVAPPAHGTLGAVDQALGTVEYTPAAGYTGSDTFTYKATDVDGDSVVATVTVTVSAPPPVVQPTPTPTPSGGPNVPFVPTGGGSSTGGGGSGGGGGGGGSGGGAQTQTPSCTISATTGCAVLVSCPAGTPGGCNGDMSGRIPGGGASSSIATASAKSIVVLKARFKVAAGAKRKVALKLTAAGKKLLRKRGKLRVTLTTTTRLGSGDVVRTTRKLTVKAARPRARS